MKTSPWIWIAGGLVGLWLLGKQAELHSMPGHQPLWVRLHNPGYVWVKWGNTSLDTRESLLDALGAQEIRTIYTTGWTLLSVPIGTEIGAVDVLKRAGIEAEPDYIIYYNPLYGSHSAG